MIGAEDLARLRTSAAFGPFTCWRCGRSGDANKEPPTAAAGRYRLITQVVLAHPRCAPSHVVDIDADAPPGAYGPQAMIAIAGVLPLGGLVVPTVVLELLAETSGRARAAGTGWSCS